MTKIGKHCGQRSNCSFWAVSSFVTMFPKSRLLQRRPKASKWGKGVKILHSVWSKSSSFNLELSSHTRTPVQTGYDQTPNPTCVHIVLVITINPFKNADAFAALSLKPDLDFGRVQRSVLVWFLWDCIWRRRPLKPLWLRRTFLMMSIFLFVTMFASQF